MTRNLLAGSLLFLVSLLLAGCASTSGTLRGVVVEGRRPGVYVVSSGDPRLTRYPIEDAIVEIVINPKDLRPQMTSSPPTLADGKFIIDPEVFGAGFLLYDLGVRATARGYSDVWGEPEWPTSSQTLLVIMAPGTGTLRRPGDDGIKDDLKHWEKPSGR
jgi:hypothetical protein